MPDLGTTVEEFRIMRWLVPEGGTIALGDELVEIETDKAVTALESTAAGTLLRQCVPEEAIAHTGDILAYIGVPGEAIPDDTPAAQTAASAPAPVAAVITAPLLAPVTRNLAAKLGVDLATVHGTGQGGVITREDVLRAAQAPKPVASSRGQAAVARAVTKSWTEIPHAYFTTIIDMTAALAARDAAKAAGAPVSYNALFLCAMARALRQYPKAGAAWHGESTRPMAGIHLALAVDLEDELFLPVLRDVDRLAPAEVQAAIDGMVAQLRQHSLPAESFSGGVMALSNLGMYSIDAFDPIVFPGHSAILAVGAITPTPVVADGQVIVRPLLKATLAVDHRAINGRLAAAFLTEIKIQMESGLPEGNR
jgi:pyruvate dehydrogenase E2 component (dihydrolipoamide acetyltransferase)